jgi:hypothetical protein
MQITDREIRLHVLKDFDITCRKEYLSAVKRVNKRTLDQVKWRKHYVYNCWCERIGVVMCLEDKFFSYSMCHPNDEWNRHVGTFFALHRAEVFRLNEIHLMPTRTQTAALAIKACIDDKN